MDAASASGIVGFDYYLKRLQEQRTGARTDALLKLVLALDSSRGGMLLLKLAAQSGMEVKVFMDAIAKMQDANLISLTGTAQAPEQIFVELTPEGRKLVPVVVQSGN
jgi:DNA-binding MarR family transcriptional regulator